MPASRITGTVRYLRNPTRQGSQTNKPTTNERTNKQTNKQTRMTGLVRQTNITKQRRVLPARASMCCGNREREATSGCAPSRPKAAKVPVKFRFKLRCSFLLVQCSARTQRLTGLRPRTPCTGPVFRSGFPCPTRRDRLQRPHAMPPCPSCATGHAAGCATCRSRTLGQSKTKPKRLMPFALAALCRLPAMVVCKQHSAAEAPA